MLNVGIASKNEYKLIKKAYESIKHKIPYKPDIAVVLGTGLGDMTKSLKIDKKIDFSEIANMPKTTNKSHKVGDLMLIKDHISFLVENPLRGNNIEELGERFVDMTDPYDVNIRKIVKKVAKKNNIALKEGIYVQTLGPTFETVSEIKLLSKLGADAVAMSLCIEAIAARHAGINVCGISVITNMATGIAKVKHSDELVRKTASKYAEKFEKLLYKTIPEISRLEITR